MTDITIKSGTDKLVSGIVNKSLQKQTVAMMKAFEAGKKAGWQFAGACHSVKLSYTGKVASDIAEQFPTIKDYANYIGVDPATIHNNARAFQFMLDHSLVPQITKKGAKTPSVNYDGFPLNVGQALVLDSFTDEQFTAIKALAESKGFTLADISVGKMKTFKKCGQFEEPRLESKEQPKAESTKEQPKAESTKEQPKAESTKEQPKAESTKEQPKTETKAEKVSDVFDPKNLTAGQKLEIIDEIIDNMILFGITIKDITVREQQRGKQA